MIRGLRKRLIAVTMAATFVVLFVMIGGMNLLNYHRLVEDADRLTQMIADHDGHFDIQKPTDEPSQPDDFSQNKTGQESTDQMDLQTPENKKKDVREMPAETPYTTRYFSVLVNDADAQVVDLTHIASVDEEQALSYGKAVSGSGRSCGFYETYRYRCEDTEEGTLIVFIDCEADLAVFRSTLFASVLTSAAGYGAVFLLVLLFSRVVLRPVQLSYEKQKQFITDASHELKTPLTIIDANVEILEMDNGESEWTKSIHNQIHRLSSLTNQLVTLARMDEEDGCIQREEFDFSEAVYDVAAGFSSVVQTRQLVLDLQVGESLRYQGQESKIRQLIGILLDNATKYAVDGSRIEVKLQKKGRQLAFSVSNEAEGLSRGEHPELFERFYRADASRSSKTGGSGIGLSVAEAIVKAHKGTIRALSPDGKRLQMTVLL